MILPALYPGTIHSYDREKRLCRVEIPPYTDGAEIFPEAEIMYPAGDESEHTESRLLVGARIWLAFHNGDSRYPILIGFRPKQTGNDTLWRRIFHENHERFADDGDIHDHASQDINTEAGRDIVTRAERDISMSAGRNEIRNIDQEYTLEAGTKITLKVGATTIEIEADKTTITSPQVMVDAATSTFTGAVIVQGLLTYQAGLAGSGGTGASANITGNVSVTGTVTATGEITSGTIGVQAHHHTAQGPFNPTTPSQP